MHTALIGNVHLLAPFVQTSFDPLTPPQLDEIGHMFGVAKIKSTLVPVVCRVVSREGRESQGMH